MCQATRNTMPRHRLLGQFPRFSRLILCIIIISLLSSVCPENVSFGSDVGNASGSPVVSNSSAKVKHENPEKLHTPPPLVEVFHGKQMNSVAHDLLGSMDEIPSLATEVLTATADNIPSHTEYSTRKSRLAEDNVTGVESLLDPVLLASLPTVKNIRNESTTIIPPPEGISQSPEPPVVVENSDIEPSTRPPPSTDNLKVPQEPLLIQKPSQDPLVPKKNDSDVHHDDIPSFSEWANKKMAEVEKNKGENHTVGTTKIRLKNYASPDCGAKVVASNPEAVSAGAVLSPSRDDYMLNPCNVKIWFVVELCESIQPQRVEIANFELFSSSPQDLSIWVSDRYPTRDWSQVATVQAKDERTVQSFPLPRLAHFAKYVKVELHSHYGSEHYCPVSLFKAFGTSELEVLDNDPADNDPDDESMQAKPTVEDDDESMNRIQDPPNDSPNKEQKKTGDDLFRTAKEAVLSIVQKAARVLGNGGARNNSCMNVSASSQCLTPGYQIVCNNCTDQFYYRLYEIVCCNGRKLKDLLSNKFVNTTVTESPLCSTIGINLSTKADNDSNLSSESSSSAHAIGMSYLRAILGEDTLAALCNYLAVSRRKTALNVSQDKSNMEEVPPGSQVDAEETRRDSIYQVTPSAEVDIEPTRNVEEPVIIISPTKTLPVEFKNLEVNGTVTTQEILTPGESSHEPEEKTETMNVTLSSVTDIPTETLQPTLHPAPIGLTETVPPTHIETVQQPPPTPDEQVPVDTNAMESLFPEEPEEEPPPQDITTKPTTVPAPVQKESVFVRLANRIKALEVNMSLSSQYLEELSRRYKKQVEELQRTLAAMVEERRLAFERENTQSAQIELLTQKTEALTAAVTQLLEEESQWSPKVYIYGQHGVIMLIEVVVLFLVLGLCRWLMNQAKMSDTHARPPLPQRRHSLDGPPVANAAQPKKRRPSEEALIPSSSTHQELLIDGVKRKTSRDGKQRRKRRRKDKLEDGLSIVSAEGEDWAPTAPEFIRTAEWSRKQRASIQTQTSSSQETLSSIAPPSSTNSSIKKKTGALKKIVKKLF